MGSSLKNTLFLIGILLCLTPILSPAAALLCGLLFSIIGIKNEALSSQTSNLLKYSIVLMGFGMNLSEVLQASQDGFWITAISVTCILFLGLFIGKLLKVDEVTGTLISVGTAICGGSAIAATAPVVNAKEEQITFALAIVFILNAIALFIFPPVGEYFELDQTTFGYWAAIAIHDTSSVVGASAAYGEQALQTGTTVKLIRALYIIPVVIGISIFRKENQGGKIKYPWFIGGFILAILVAHYFKEGAATYEKLHWLGKRGMIIALFLIGNNISIQKLKKAGGNGLILGVLLWLMTGVVSLILLLQ